MAEARTLEQERARRALLQTSDLKSAEEAEKYHRDAAGFGPMVLSNGLAGAWAFMTEKKKSRFLEHVQAWLIERPSVKRLQGGSLLARLSDEKCDASTYREITQEALLYANWLKRLAGARKKS